MNTTLEDRLRHHYDERTRDLPTTGPGIGTVIATVSAGPMSGGAGRRRLVLIGSAAAALVVGLVLINRAPDDRGAANVPKDPAGVPLSPSETLPDDERMSEVPVTVSEPSPYGYYELQPDLHIAWVSNDAGGTDFCWRTPADSGCTSNDNALPLVVPTAGGQTLVVVDPDADGAGTLDVTLAGGSVLSAPVVVDATMGWRIARFIIPDGDSIEAIGNASTSATEPRPPPSSPTT